MYRFFISSEAVTDGALAITGEDVNHAKNVLRMRVGEELEAVDEDRFLYHCRILELTEEEIRCEILKKEEPDSELASSVTLFMGLPKGDKFELILQKAVELGVSEVVPVLTKRTVSRPEPKKAESKRKRWQAIAEAAAKQSKRAVIPEVGGLVSFAEALKRAGAFRSATAVVASGVQSRGEKPVPPLVIIRSACRRSARRQSSFFSSSWRFKMFTWISFSQSLIIIKNY